VNRRPYDRRNPSRPSQKVSQTLIFFAASSTSSFFCLCFQIVEVPTVQSFWNAGVQSIIFHKMEAKNWVYILGPWVLQNRVSPKILGSILILGKKNIKSSLWHTLFIISSLGYQNVPIHLWDWGVILEGKLLSLYILFFSKVVWLLK
jgi:hypothetical protein